MKITIEATDVIVQVNDRPARVWRGATDTGIAIDAFVALIRVRNTADVFAFDVELEEQQQQPDAVTIDDLLQCAVHLQGLRR
jgi:hypothetical protein